MLKQLTLRAPFAALLDEETFKLLLFDNEDEDDDDEMDVSPFQSYDTLDSVKRKPRRRQSDSSGNHSLSSDSESSKSPSSRILSVRSLPHRFGGLIAAIGSSVKSAVV